MKKIKLLMLLGIFMLGACTNEMQDAQLPAVGDDTQNVLMSKTERLYAVKKPRSGGSGMTPQAVAVINKLWAHQDTVKIKFLNGNQDVRDKVVEYGAEWLEYINLSFEYVGDNDPSDVKIGFEYENENPCPYVSWVTVGTDCRSIPQDEATINFVGMIDEYGNVYDDPENEPFIRADILRAYGAMLGLGFEHRSPNSTVTFFPLTSLNKNRLVGHFGVGIQQIIDEIITLYTTEQTKYTAYDGTSIMMLPIPRSFVNNNTTYPTDGNFELSATDKCFIAALYPKTFEIEWVCDGFGYAGGILYMDASDNLYFFRDVNSARKLMKMDTQGVITELFTVPSQYLSLSTGLAADNSGLIYLSDGSTSFSSSSHNMWQFDATGTLLKTFNRQLSSNEYAAFGQAMGVLDNNELIYVAGLSTIPVPGSSSFHSVWSYRYNAGTEVATPLTNLSLPFSYGGGVVSSNNLVYFKHGPGLIKLNTDAGTCSLLTPAYAADDISNAAAPSDDPYIAGLSASRDIADITFLRKGLYEVYPGCGQMRTFLFTYNPNCDSSCEARNFGMLPVSITKPDGSTTTNNYGYFFTASTRNGKITYVLSDTDLYKVTNHR
jgi:hypothetical protein